MQPYILVMEDEDALATLLQYNLEKEGYDVTVAADGEEGMLQIDERQPDLVLLDWMLPKLSGIEVCRRIRGKAETRNLPIIMLTARGEEGDRIRGLDAGADDYVSKPFSPTELVARIRAVLRRIRPALADEALGYADIVERRFDAGVRLGESLARGMIAVPIGPLERQVVRLSRAGRSEQFPAAALLVATGNPCGCGELDSLDGSCLCTPRARRHGSLSLSAPIRDRFALRIRLGRPVAPISTLPTGGLTTAAARELVDTARAALPVEGETSKRVDPTLLRAYARRHTDRISGRGWEHLATIACVTGLLSGRETFGEAELAEALHVLGAR